MKITRHVAAMSIYSMPKHWLVESWKCFIRKASIQIQERENFIVQTMANDTVDSSKMSCVNIDIFPFFVAVFITNVVCLVAVLQGKPRRAAAGLSTELQTHRLVCTLSLSDTLNLGLQCLMPVTSFVNCGWWGGKLSCDLYGYLSAILIVWSAWIVALMTVARAVAAIFPFHYRIHFTTRNVAIALTALLLLHSIFLATPLFGVGQFVYYEMGQFCSLSLTPTGAADTIFLGVLVTEGLVVVALVLISTAWLTASLERRNRETIVQRRAAVNRTPVATSFVPLTKAVAVLFCLCYLPLMVWQLYCLSMFFIFFLSSWNGTDVCSLKNNYRRS